MNRRPFRGHWSNAYLYAGGFFTSAGGVAVNNIAKWNGASWSPLGDGVDSGVLALAAFDDGNGPALYAGGFFENAGGNPAKHIAKWNGTSWTPLGAGFNSQITSLAVVDFGAGPDLYAGGPFSVAGGDIANAVAKWDGASWTALGTGVNYWAQAMVALDDGSGPALYVAGEIDSAGGQNASSIARWDGNNWTPMGSGNGTISALGSFDDGTGNGIALFAGSGPLRLAGRGPRSNFSVLTDGIAKWTGSDWISFGFGVDGGIYSLASFDDGSGPALYGGGRFTLLDNGVRSGYIFKYACASLDQLFADGFESGNTTAWSGS